MCSRFLSLVGIFIASLALCVGCNQDSGSTGNAVANSGDAETPEIGSANVDEGNSRPGSRVAATREAFVNFVANETAGGPDDGFILFLKIPGMLSLAERTESYSDPIDKALRQGQLGEVISGTAMMGAKPFSGVIVDVNDLDKGLDVVIEALRVADAPQGTEIRYGEAEDKMFLRFDDLN